MELVHRQGALERQYPFLPEADISGLGKQNFLCSHKGLRKRNPGPLQREFSLDPASRRELFLCAGPILPFGACPLALDCVHRR